MAEKTEKTKKDRGNNPPQDSKHSTIPQTHTSTTFQKLAPRSGVATKPPPSLRTPKVIVLLQPRVCATIVGFALSEDPPPISPNQLDPPPLPPTAPPFKNDPAFIFSSVHAGTQHEYLKQNAPPPHRTAPHRTTRPTVTESHRTRHVAGDEGGGEEREYVVRNREQKNTQKKDVPTNPHYETLKKNLP